MPLYFRCSFKPTPSIAKTQKTVNLATKQNVEINYIGRNDPCIGVRATVVVESLCALFLMYATK